MQKVFRIYSQEQLDKANRYLEHNYGAKVVQITSQYDTTILIIETPDPVGDPCGYD